MVEAWCRKAKSTEPVVFDLAFDGFWRRVGLRRNGDGVRYVYDSGLMLELRCERDDALLASYTYAHGTILKQQRETEERCQTALAVLPAGDSKDFLIYLTERLVNRER